MKNAAFGSEDDIARTSSGLIKMTEFVESHEGLSVHVPYPLISSVTVRISPQTGVTAHDQFGKSLWKTQRILELLLRRYRFQETGLEASVFNPVPPGRGCATSTTNMNLAAWAAASLLKIPLDVRWLCRTMSKVEPTDCITVPDGFTCIWNFKKARPVSAPFRIPCGSYVGVVPITRSLDTDIVDQNRPRYTALEKNHLKDVFAQIRGVLQTRSVAGLAYLSTVSADINHQYFPNSALRMLRRLVTRGSILGYSVAHSGTAALAIGALGSLPYMLPAVADAVGPGYEVSGFEYRPDHERLPFLMATKLVTA